MPALFLFSFKVLYKLLFFMAHKLLSSKTAQPPKGLEKKACEEQLKAIKEELFELQNTFFADGRFGLLVILQGVDTSGKDGTIRNAFTSMNPAGVQVTSFKAPTEEEMNHDFLWRIYPHIPGRRMIGIFNRSYYEDILVPTLKNTLPAGQLAHRYTFINELEAHLALNNIHVLKILLHISKEEQQKKLAARKTDARKRWKYAKDDDSATAEWEENMKTYTKILDQCNAQPWHIVPADKRWYRNYKVAQLLLEQLKALPLRYPDSATE